MILCKDCIDYLMSRGELKGARISAEPIWEYDPPAEETFTHHCEWCEDGHDDGVDELYEVEW